MIGEENIREETVQQMNKQNLHITLTFDAISEANCNMKLRGMEVRNHFDGPIFEDIMGYQVNADWVAVSLKDGTTYVYPAASIARIKHFSVKE